MLNRAQRDIVAASLLMSPVTIFLAIFFFVPMSIIFVFSWLEPGLYGGVEWSFYHWNYGRIFGWADGVWEIFEPYYVQAILRSIRLAFITVVMCILLAYPLAFWVSRQPRKRQSFLLFMVTLPFFASMIVRLYAWILILKPTGFINSTLLMVGIIDEPIDILFSEAAVILGMTYLMLPFAFFPLYSSIEALDWSNVEASADLGARPHTTFQKVVLPQTLHGIFAASVIVFIPSVGNFIIPEILGGAKVMMVGNMIEQQFLDARNWPFGSALAMTVMAIILTIMLLYARYLKSRRGANSGSGGLI